MSFIKEVFRNLMKSSRKERFIIVGIGNELKVYNGKTYLFNLKLDEEFLITPRKIVYRGRVYTFYNNRFVTYLLSDLNIQEGYE